jgi:DNA (cytosine-5)-methyltransferase 1
MKILNLYANIGGNRKLWGDSHEITAVELDPKIAAIYKDFWLDDTVVVGDAHQYLLDHFGEFDFIWSSPPCPTHSKARFAIAKGTDFEKYPSKQKPAFPDMTLYEEILFLKHYFSGKWCVENVIAFYEPLIKPTVFGGHFFWTNFSFPVFETEDRAHTETVENLQIRKGFDLSKYSGIDKRLMLRDITEPELGKHILDYALKEDLTLFPPTL